MRARNPTLKTAVLLFGIGPEYKKYLKWFGENFIKKRLKWLDPMVESATCRRQGKTFVISVSYHSKHFVQMSGLRP